MTNRRVHDNHRYPAHKQTPEPNLFDYIPKNVWREVYNGRWAELSKLQRFEFVLETVCFLALFGGLAFYYYKGGNLLNWLLGFGAVGLVLAAFFFLLTCRIR